MPSSPQRAIPVPSSLASSSRRITVHSEKTQGRVHSDLIVAIAKSRDRAAFAALFRYFAPRVKSYLLRAGVAPSLAEDLMQEVMLKVWRKAEQFDPQRAGASTWIFTIARNLCFDEFQRPRNLEIAAGDLYGEAPAGTIPDKSPDCPSDGLEETARIRCISEAISGLPGAQAELVHLSFFEDRAHGEIATMLALPLGTVKSRLRLAIRHLRMTIRPDFL